MELTISPKELWFLLVEKFQYYNSGILHFIAPGMSYFHAFSVGTVGKYLFFIKGEKIVTISA